MPQTRATSARQESLSDKVESTSSTRGPAYLNGASHGNTGLAPPRWKFEFERPAGEDYWRKEAQSSPYLFNRNKHQYVWGADRPIKGPELGDRKAGGTSTMPLDVLERRKSFTQRPIAIVSGVHGSWHGNNWDDTGGRPAGQHDQAFLSEDIVARINGNFVQNNTSGVFYGFNSNKQRVKGDLSGYLLKRDAKTGLEYYVSDSAPKGSFESRIRIYDGAKMTEADVKGLIDDLGNHVILGYCFSRNDETLRYQGAQAPLPPVTSYLSEKKVSPGKQCWTPVGAVLRSNGVTHTLDAGSLVECSSKGQGRLRISPPNARHFTTQPGDTLWFPPAYKHAKNLRAPTETVYKAHNP